MNIGDGPHLRDIRDDFLLDQAVGWSEITDQYLGLLGVEGLDFLLGTHVLTGQFLTPGRLEGPPAGQGSGIDTKATELQVHV